MVGLAKNKNVVSKFHSVYSARLCCLPKLSPVFVRTCITLCKHETNIKNANFSIIEYFLSNFCLGSTVLLNCFQFSR